jgi:hypothetical protein
MSASRCPGLAVYEPPSARPRSLDCFGLNRRLATIRMPIASMPGED